jgi:hypothetical protein
VSADLCHAENNSLIEPSNLIVDPKERKAYDFPYMHSWTGVHFGKILKEYADSVQREPLIPAGAPLNYVPIRKS